MPEHMFYGLVEFEVADPDGYRVLRKRGITASADALRRGTGTFSALTIRVARPVK
jgi:hypothetical protein